MALFAEPAQGLVARSQLLLGGDGIVGEHDPPEIDREKPDRVPELRHSTSPPLEQCVGLVHLPLHRASVPEHG